MSYNYIGRNAIYALYDDQNNVSDSFGQKLVLIGKLIDQFNDINRTHAQEYNQQETIQNNLLQSYFSSISDNQTTHNNSQEISHNQICHANCQNSHEITSKILTNIHETLKLMLKVQNKLKSEKKEIKYDLRELELDMREYKCDLKDIRSEQRYVNQDIRDMKEEMDQRLNLFEKEQTKKFLNQINQFKNEVQQSTNETGWIDPVSKQLVINLDKARENISAETSYNIKSQESYMKPLVEETQLGSREKINTYLKKRKIVKIKESNADLISKASAAHYSTKLPIITQNKPKLQKPNQFPCYLNNQAQKPTVAKRPINAHYSQGRSSQSTQLTKPLYQNLIPKNNPLNINIIASQNHSSLQREKWAKNYILARSQNSFPQSIINQKRYVLNGTESKKPSNIQKLWAFKQLQYIESVVKM